MNDIDYAIIKLVALYEDLDSYSNNRIRDKLKEIIENLRGLNND